MNHEMRLKWFEEHFKHLPGYDYIFAYLIDNGFFVAPASTKYHGSYEGGLFDHSKNVAEMLVDLTEKLHLQWERSESPYIVGFFHDLCKIDCYCHPTMAQTIGGEAIKDSNRWEYNPNTLFKGHGDKSLMLLSSLILLTEEEAACIRYHMGAFTKESEWSDYTSAIHKFPNVLFTHTADMMAAHILEKGE